MGTREGTARVGTLWVALLTAALMLGVSRPAGASTITVGCDTAALIAAINAANATQEADTLELAGGCTYVLTVVDNDPGEGANGLPIVTTDINIHGNGATITRTSEEATPTFRILMVKNPASVSLTDLTISGGDPGPANTQGQPTEGGGVLNFGTLTTSHTTISNSTAARGGGIANNGLLTAADSMISGNQAPSVGGGIFNFGTLTVTDSSVSKNTAAQGGGIQNIGHLAVTDSTFSSNDADVSGGALEHLGSPATIDNSTFSGNTAGQGAGIANGARLTVTNSTFAGNQADGAGGAIHNADEVTIGYQLGEGILSLTNSTVAGNSAGTTGGVENSSPDGSATIENTIVANNAGGNCLAVADGGHNLAWPPTDLTCPPTFTSGDPKLGALADNGGPTQTMALGRGSAALDRVPSTGADCPATDQRGVPRPQDGDTNGTSDCDIGSFELEAPDLGIALAAAPNPVKQGSQLTYTITVHNFGSVAAKSLTLTNTFPTGSQFVSVSAAGWTCQAPAQGSTGTMTCTRAGLDAGGDAVIQAVVTIIAPKKTTVTDSATVMAATLDPNPANDSASVAVVVK